MRVGLHHQNQMVTTCVNCAPGSLIRPTRLLLEAGLLGILCQASTEIPDSRWGAGQGFRVNHKVAGKWRLRGSFFLGNSLNLPEI